MIDNIGINNLEIRCLKEFFVLNFLVYCLCFPYVYQFTVCDLETIHNLGSLEILDHPVFSLFFEIQVSFLVTHHAFSSLFSFFFLLVTNKLKKKNFPACRLLLLCYFSLNSSIQVCKVTSLLAYVKCRCLYCFTV